MGIEGAPRWAHEARILTATQHDIGRLKEMAEVHSANVVFLYMVPEGEVSNGWCPRGTYDEMGAFVLEAHRFGLKVISYFDFSLASEDYYPGREDWVQKNRDGKPEHRLVKHIGKERYALCPNSPWYGYLVEVASKRARLGLDGMFLDNPNFYAFDGESCYCSHCARAFRMEHGADLCSVPGQVHLAWKGRSLGKLMQEVQRTLSSSGRETVVTCNVCGDEEPRTVRTLAPYENVVFREVWEIESVDWTSLSPRLQGDRQASGGKPEWVTLPLGIGEPFERTAPGCKLAIACKVAGGARPFMWAQEVSVDPAQTGLGTRSIYNVQEVSEALRSYYQFLERVEDRLRDAEVLRDDVVRLGVGGHESEIVAAAYRTDRSLIVHLVNLTGVGTSKTAAPVPQNHMRVELALPAGCGPSFAAQRVTILSPDFEETLDCDFEVSNDAGGALLSLTIPKLLFYDIIIVE